MDAYNVSAKRTPAWLDPLLVTSCFRLDVVEQESQRNMTPGTPTVHARAPNRFLQEIVHL